MSIALTEKRWKKIGSLLQKERNLKKLGQDIFSRKMDTRQESISRMETGTRKIDILELIEYAEVLGFSITDIAWKIETYLHAEGLLPPPKPNIKEKKIGLEVSWCENRFSATYREFGPKAVVLRANTFKDLQEEAKTTITKLVNAKTEAGGNAPRWLSNEEYKFEYRFLDAKSLLNAYSPYISLAAISHVSGINQNLLSQYANGIKNARPNQLKRIAEAIQKIGKELTAIVP